MKAAFAGSIAVRLAEPVRRRLTIPCEIVTGDEAAILHQLGDASVLVSMAFTKEMAIAGPNLRLVQVPGAGLDRIERSQIRLGLALANAYGHEAGIAEYVIGAMIALTRSFQRLDQKLRAGQWESQWSIGTPAPPLWPELAGKTLGILGFGHIGEALARRARAFDMKVCAVRRHAQSDVPQGLTFIGGPERLDELLGLSDYLAVTLSLSPETHGLIDARRLIRIDRKCTNPAHEVRFHDPTSPSIHPRHIRRSNCSRKGAPRNASRQAPAGLTERQPARKDQPAGKRLLHEQVA